MKTPVILVPLDGTEAALSALPVARALAEVQGSILHLVYIARVAMPPAEVFTRIGLDARDLRGSVLSTRPGEPAEGILHIARELHCAFIVMCAYTAADPRDRILGSTAFGILKEVVCPVVLVPPQRGIRPWSLHRILLPHDGTPTTSAAIRPAAELARSAAAELDVLHVAASHTRPPAAHGSLSLRYMDHMEYEWPDWAGEFLARLHCVCPLNALHVRMALAHGSPAEEVVRFAAEHASDLIVLAWKGEWQQHARIVKAVLHRAPCPVLIVRAEQ